MCKKRMEEHNLDPSNTAVKVWPHGLPAIYFNSILLDVSSEKLLNDEHDQQQQDPDGFMLTSTILDHEIGHLKNKDHLKGTGLQVFSGLLQYRMTAYLARSSRLKRYFCVPTSLGNCMTMLLSHCLAGAAGKSAKGWINTKYRYHREKEADEYAISHAKEPRALKLAAQHAETTKREIVRNFCDFFKLYPTLVIQRHGLRHGIELLFVSKRAYQEYQQEGSDKSFCQWILDRPELTNKILRICDPTHPTWIDRAKRFTQAADELEKKLKKSGAQE